MVRNKRAQIFIFKPGQTELNKTIMILVKAINRFLVESPKINNMRELIVQMLVHTDNFSLQQTHSLHFFFIHLIFLFVYNQIAVRCACVPRFLPAACSSFHYLR